jgi:hypothetical protein
MNHEILRKFKSDKKCWNIYMASVGIYLGNLGERLEEVKIKKKLLTK